MREGTRTALLEEVRLDEEIVKRATAATEEVSPGDRVRAGLEAAIAEAEVDLAAARSALHELRRDHLRLSRLEAWVGGGDSDRVTFGLGAAIQLADAELASASPDLGRLVPELLRWLEGDW